MDVLYHGIVGFAIAKTLGPRYEAAGVLAAIAPDIAGSIPYFYFKLQEVSTKSVKIFVHDFVGMFGKNKFKNNIDRIPYQTTHSLFFAALVSIFAYIFFRPAWPVVSLSYISHILIDIPTHDGDFTTYFLFPFSRMHVNGKNWAKNPGIFFAFWGGLILLLPAAVLR